MPWILENKLKHESLSFFLEKIFTINKLEKAEPYDLEKLHIYALFELGKVSGCTSEWNTYP